MAEDKLWGRVLICGGTEWAKLGRKDKGPKVESELDLLSPNILRSLATVRAKSIHTSALACHVVVISIEGIAYLFGRNEKSVLGRKSPKDTVSEDSPLVLSPQSLGAEDGVKFVHAACGRYHTLLVGSGGETWSAGMNNLGQCGHPTCPEVTSFKLVKPFDESDPVVQAAAGLTFSLLLTASGKIYSCGSGESGQLGHNRTGEYITSGNKSGYAVVVVPTLVKGLEQASPIKQIAAGQAHALALSTDGMVYVWGNNGYGRLGVGDTKDALMPKLVPTFAGPNELTKAAFIAAGPTNSVVIDRQGMYYMAGKWKNSGDGSSGAPWSSFRYMPDIMGCKIAAAASGGATHFALSYDPSDPMTIAWGQNCANGELGLGDDAPKSATKPSKVEPLDGIEVLSVAAGQNTTYFIAKPSDKFSDLPRHPEIPDGPDMCVVCNTSSGDDDVTLQCDKCDTPYHLTCLNPALDDVPEGEWFCEKCAKGTPTTTQKLSLKRNADVAKEDASQNKKKKSIRS